MIFEDIAISYKPGNEPSNYTKGRNIPDQVSDY
jgi:hypothetical protein